MISKATSKQEAVQDLWYGQVVTIIARWFLIGAGVILTCGGPSALRTSWFRFTF